MDFSQLEDADPSCADGSRVFYEREVPFELRSVDGLEIPEEVGTLEAVRVKICVQGPDGAYTNVKIELCSESNLFFHYTHDLDTAAYAALQEGQRLMVDFKDYPAVIQRNLNNCIKQPHAFLAVLVMQKTGGARLDFIQNMEYKFVELLSIDLDSTPEEATRAHVTYRYNAMKGRLALCQARLADVNALVKIKNPSLLLQLKNEERSRKGVRSP